jgi:hydrocephalus-inducing protein
VQLAPGQVLLPSTKENPIKLEVPIIFTPRIIKKYAETIKFDFNGLYTIDVNVNGEGIPMQLELVDPDQALVDFGIVSVGGDVTKTVSLVNKSKKPVTFTLAPSNADQFKKCNLALTPDKEVTLKPREVVPIEIRYAPKQRMPPFDIDLMLNIKDNESRQLIQVQGVSHGIEMKLMDAVVAFGSVVRNSRLTKILQLANFGDVKAQYKWDNKVYSKYFTITPEQGYVNPNSTLDLEVTFHPTVADSDIRFNQVKCEIKGGDPLNVTLMGKSVEQDPSTT